MNTLRDLDPFNEHCQVTWLYPSRAACIVYVLAMSDFARRRKSPPREIAPSSLPSPFNFTHSTLFPSHLPACFGRRSMHFDFCFMSMHMHEVS